MLKKDPPIITQQNFNQPIEKVWNALTKFELMRLWFFDNIPYFEAKVGFKTQFNVQAPSRDFLHIWEIIQVIPFQKIVYNWSFKECLGSADVSFELFEADNKTLLKVTNKVIEDFDENIPEFKRESCQAGWNYFIKDNLNNYLN